MSAHHLDLRTMWAMLAACALMGSALLLSSCGRQSPTVEEIRIAYATHMQRDRVHERGLRAKQTPVVIPQQDPQCTADGNAHFDCRIRIFFENPAGRRSEEQHIHIRRVAEGWAIDSID